LSLADVVTSDNGGLLRYAAEGRSPPITGNMGGLRSVYHPPICAVMGGSGGEKSNEVRDTVGAYEAFQFDRSARSQGIGPPSRHFRSHR
jgi:hypothetical protein